MPMLYHFDVEVSPGDTTPDALLSQKPRSKWHWPRRIIMLAKPKQPRDKFVYPDPHAPFEPHYHDRIDPDCIFRNDHLARLPIRKFRDYDWKAMSKKTAKNLREALDDSWDAIYVWYRRQLRDKRRRAMERRRRRLAERKRKSKKTDKQIKAEREAHDARLARPKKVFYPRRPKHKWKPLEQLFAAIEQLAEPKRRPRIITNPVPTIVSQSAKEYVITDEILKLTKLSERKRWRPDEERPCNYVSPYAVKYGKMTPRLDVLSKPSAGRSEAKKAEDESNPFEISKNALKYKPTARILELAKPLERD